MRKILSFTLLTLIVVFLITCEKFEVKYSTKVQTVSASAGITSVSATGKVIDLSDENHSEYGFCYAESSDATVDNGKVSLGSAKMGDFSGSIRNLKMGTTYYVRAFCKDGDGYKYGDEKRVTTANVVVTTNDVSGITRTAASAGGGIEITGDVTITQRGVCWSTSQNPLAKGLHTNDGSGTGSFSSQMTGLLNNTTYYIRAYAIAVSDTVYGPQKSFKTLDVSVPELTTQDVSAIGSTTAASGGTVTADGGREVTARGVCWGVNPNPTVTGTSTSDGNGLGSFTSNLEGLTPGTTYHVRAYATNSVGTGYGQDITFTTNAILPTVSTLAVSNITSSTVETGGNIAFDGGASITQKGVCWSTTANPTIANSKTEDGQGAGIFNSAISGLNFATTYHVRAYATNSVGTAYGEDLQFTTSAILPAITTSEITSITANSAVSGGVITSDGGATITKKGVCWSISENPTIDGSKTDNGTGATSFTSNITGLNPNTIYYVRAYATNSVGTSYGEQRQLTTSISMPVITTNAVSSVASTSVTAGGNVTSNGGTDIDERGICWSTSINPTISGNHIADVDKTIGSYSISITGLNPGTTYHVRAYATNSLGTAYGANVTFTTNAILSTVTTASIINITGNSATSGGTITYDGGATITKRGVCWSKNQNPTINGVLCYHTEDGDGTGSFASNIAGLVPATTYYVRAYATNSVGTSYGDEISFTTSIILPVVTTTAVSSITSTSVTAGGNITTDGGSEVTGRGICWSLAENPTINDSHIADLGIGTGSFSLGIAGLTPGTTYHVRAYATNSLGTAYGADVSFTTLAIQPTVTTASISNVTGISASGGGNVTTDGGATVSKRGVCWSTDPNPTISNSHTENGTGTGEFTSSITGLTPATTYYVKAYATNSVGTAYGDEVSFTTSVIAPTVTTLAISGIASTTAIAGGNVTSNGGESISERGICWGTSPDPTTDDNKIIDAGTGIGAYNLEISGLTPGTTYHVRAYAINSQGTSYGADISFTTNAILPTVTTTEASIITTSTASTGGDVTYNGGAVVTSRGVCWSTSENPKIHDSKLYSGSGNGSFTCDLTGLAPGTIYHVRAFATNSVGTNYGNDISFTTLVNLPTVTTTLDQSKIGITTATVYGEVTSNGGGEILERGICWGTTTTPTINDSKVTEAGGMGSFTGVLSGLSAFTGYYARAYATNSAGTAYGNYVTIVTFKSDAVVDYDGNYYNTVTIGSQVWMQSNLKTTHYNDGTEILNVTNSTAWTALTYGGYCWYDNDEKYKTYPTHYYSYGALYNVYAIIDSHNLCPSGWHVPSDSEWSTLETYLGGTSAAGGKLKATWTDYNGSTEGWTSPNTSADNSSSFFALPGGFRVGYNGNFSFRKQNSMFGTSSETYHSQSYNAATSSGASSAYKTHGFSVRCVKD